MSASQRLRRTYALALGILAAGALVLRLAAPASALGVLAVVLTFVAAVPLLAWGVRRLWRRVTYRVGVRLFISYLLIGLTPFALFALFGLVAGYVLVGQYAATLVRAEMEHLTGAMGERTASAAHDLSVGQEQRARALLAGEGRAADSGMCEAWLLADGERVWSSPDAAALAVPRWSAEGAWQGEVVAGESAYLATVARRGDRIAVLLLPLDLANARAFPGRSWYQLRFVTAVRRATPAKAGGGAVEVATGGEGSKVRIDGRPVAATQVEPSWLAPEPREGSFWRRIHVLWIWLSGTPHDLATGSPVPHAVVLALIKLSPQGALEDLFGPSDRLRGEVKGIAVALGGVFGAIYLIAVGFAVVMILRVTRATARLSRGARAVARGDLEYRIPVGPSDQLGELTASFNSMAGSVRSMLAQVAERERMAKEVELAREIQSSLLPPAELSSGPLSVWAHFRPAAEVGGDYFDLFPLPQGNLLVAIGDVAGHGLPTGLLMAMVKSAVATLVEEGHRGGELVTRLNHLLLAQSLKQRMVSFALADVDPVRGTVEITSAGHQPGVLLAAGGTAEEVLLSSLPLGHRWLEPPPTRVLRFGVGGRLLLYSDGLVEARAADGAPFGHERLRAALEAHRHEDGPTVVRALLAELDRFLAGQPLGDDLTIVLVEHRLSPA